MVRGGPRMVIDLRTSRPCFVNGEGSSIPHNDSTRIETDATDFHGLGPLSGSAMRETYSRVFPNHLRLSV